MAQSSNLRLPTAAQWKRQIIEDIELQAIDAGVTIPPTAKGSDFDLKATSLGNALAVVTANLAVQDADGNALTAEGAQLEEIRISEGLPEAPASQSTGRATVKSTALEPVVIVDGTALLCPGALPAKVVGTHPGVVDGSAVAFTVTKAGSAGNLKAGTVVRFSAPPPGIASDAAVIADMVDGSDTEGDAKKRRRILNRRQNPPKGGNWSHLRELVLGSSNSLDNAFVYPALGLPSSCLIALTAPWYASATGQSRGVTPSTIAAAEFAIADAVNTGAELYAVKATTDEPVDWRLLLDVLPGNASWTDVSPWPSVGAHVSSFTSSTRFVIDTASDTTAPAIGKSIAIWDPTVLGFRTATIVSVPATFSASSYEVTTTAWQGGALTMAVNLQVSPAARNMAAWGASLVAIVGKQTPGEACLDWQEPISLRLPYESNDEPTGIGARELAEFIGSFDEIRDAITDTINVDTPTRVTPSGAPNVLCLRSISLGVK